MSHSVRPSGIHNTTAVTVQEESCFPVEGLTGDNKQGHDEDQLGDEDSG